ncbi:hypothetical protein BN1723_011292 [Verticillium longisporum]|uniref:Uncharacterized protein n=1 Tax=Verticillium longisporum TaxID=100787 RepID=A0A0G4L5T6_VERLO|nr:hypothetical protein BN1723_011292 [Verticillium longisporum]
MALPTPEPSTAQRITARPRGPLIACRQPGRSFVSSRLALVSSREATATGFRDGMEGHGP